MDSHGDIFGQLFKDKNRDMQQDEQENPAVQIAKEWVEALESQIKHCFKTNGRSVVKDVRDIFEGIISATSSENVSSGIFDQLRFKPACSAIEAS